MATRVHNQSVLTFDGRDDYINFGNTALGGALAVRNSTLTILGWVNPHRLTQKASVHGTPPFPRVINVALSQYMPEDKNSLLF
ncbi:MAG: hypothetical protein WBM86_07235 [Waterburya sp.]